MIYLMLLSTLILTVIVVKESVQAHWDAQDIITAWYEGSSEERVSHLIWAAIKMGLISSGRQWDGERIVHIGRQRKISYLTSIMLVIQLSQLRKKSLKNLPKEITLYRGISNKAWEMIKDGIYQPRSFESWSRDKSLASSFGPVLISRKFVRGEVLFSADVTGNMVGRTEQEVTIFFRGNYPLVERIN